VEIWTYLEDVSVELLLELLVGPIDTELLERVLLEVLETVLIVSLRVSP
jgi:hypothetical protein